MLINLNKKQTYVKYFTWDHASTLTVSSWKRGFTKLRSFDFLVCDIGSENNNKQC